MSRTQSIEKLDKSSREWNRAISEAEDMLTKAKGEKAERLKTHIAWMKESRDAGEKWGDQPIKKPTIAGGPSAGTAPKPGGVAAWENFPARL